MRMIGWCDDLYADEMAGHGQESDVDYVELLSNMAGNAWSMFHYAPLQVYVFSPNWKTSVCVNSGFLNGVSCNF